MDLEENIITVEPKLIEEETVDEGLDFLDIPTEVKPDSEPQPAQVKDEQPVTPKAEPTPSPIAIDKARRYQARTFTKIFSAIMDASSDGLAKWALKRELKKRLRLDRDLDDLVDLIESTGKNELTTEQKAAGAKILKKWLDEKLPQLPISKEERAQIEDEFYQYFVATNKIQLSPEATLILGLGSIAASRVTTIMF